VGKEELVEEIWDHTAVTDNALVQCITTIRKVLGDDSRHPRFIKTIPKVGYRFIRPIEVTQGTGSPEAVGAERTGAHQALRKGVGALRQRAAIVGVAALLLVTGSWLMVRRAGGVPQYATLHPAPGKKAIAVVYFDNQSADVQRDWLREGLADMLITDLAQSDH